MSSHWDQLTQVMDIVMQFKPTGVLDIGPGRGKYGVLIGEYIRDWAEKDVVVDAIALEPIWCRHAYHEVFRGDAIEILPRIWKRYHLVILIDVIEHLTRENGENLLRAAVKVGQRILITTPKDTSKCGDHKSSWTPGTVSKCLERTVETYNHSRAWIMLVEGDFKP